MNAAMKRTHGDGDEGAKGVMPISLGKYTCRTIDILTSSGDQPNY